MSNKGRSEPGLFGSIHHYDEHGKKIGRSDPGLFGGYTNYDAKGNKIGHSDPGLFGGYNHYDAKGHKTGHSDPGLFGSYHHRDSNGKSTGSSDPGLFGSYHHNDNQGCYIATCVYGSYDCPQVWTLRRFRDNTLAETLFGRLCIHTYYAVSPTVVRWFGKTKWFRRMWQEILDRMVHFDQMVSSTVLRCKRSVRDDNSSLMLVLPYPTSEFENNEDSFYNYYDEIEICEESARAHFKGAMQFRNRHMVDRADLIVCYIEHNEGGAYQTVQYAKKQDKKIINLAELEEE